MIETGGEPDADGGKEYGKNSGREIGDLTLAVSLGAVLRIR